MNLTFDKAKRTQKSFSDLFFDSETISQAEKEERLRSFALAMHTEVSDMASAVKLKDHHLNPEPADDSKILYNLVDIARYVFASLNLWQIDNKAFERAWEIKDAYLWEKHRLESLKYEGQPAVIIDIDDVLAHFREDFFAWLDKKYNFYLDAEGGSYFHGGTLLDGKTTIEDVYREFRETNGGLMSVRCNDNIVNSLRVLEKSGVWIHILTARPSSDLHCYYETFAWLLKNKIPYHSIDFNPEKFRAASTMHFYLQNKLLYAVDDSPKNAREYSSQGIPVFVPKRGYNLGMENEPGLKYFDWHTFQLPLSFEQ